MGTSYESMYITNAQVFYVGLFKHTNFLYLVAGPFIDEEEASNYIDINQQKYGQSVCSLGLLEQTIDLTPKY